MSIVVDIISNFFIQFSFLVFLFPFVHDPSWSLPDILSLFLAVSFVFLLMCNTRRYLSTLAGYDSVSKVEKKESHYGSMPSMATKNDSGEGNYASLPASALGGETRTNSTNYQPIGVD